MLNRKIRAKDYTGICLHCECKLETKKEKEQNYCEKCWVQYVEEMDAIYGNEWRS